MIYIIVLILLALSALFSGLTLGFFSLKKDDLKHKAELGDKKIQKLYKLRKKGNLLLCTLLIGNVAVNSTLALFLGSITSGVVAGFLATALIVVFGEILPQSLFARFALALCIKFSWLVRLFIIILFPVCWPIAWSLDKILGDEASTVYSKQELIKLIEHQEDLEESEVDTEEEQILKGALSFSDKKVKEIMTPIKKVLMIKANKKLDKKTVMQIRTYGHSRIPVYDKSKNDIKGVLYVKDLVGLNVIGKTVLDLSRKHVIMVYQGETLDDILDQFKKTRKHLFIVEDKKHKVSGIVTVEDVLEEIIGAEIIDEFDKEGKVEEFGV